MPSSQSAELPCLQGFTSRSRKPPLSLLSLFRCACLCLRALYVSLHPFLVVEVVLVVCPNKQPPQDLSPHLRKQTPQTQRNNLKQPLRKGSAEAIRKLRPAEAKPSREEACGRVLRKGSLFPSTETGIKPTAPLSSTLKHSCLASRSCSHT